MPDLIGQASRLLRFLMICQLGFGNVETESITVLQSYEAANWYFSPLEWTARSRSAGHFGAVVDATFSPNGEIVVTASRDCTVCIWSATGRQIRVLRKHTKPVASVAFSPDGSRFVTSSEDGLAIIWSIDGFSTPLRGHRKAICFAAFSRDNKTEAFAERTWAGVPPLLSGSAGRRRVGFADFRLSHGVYFPISTCSGQTPGVIRPAPAHA
jgi:WD40 repeat protein